MSVEFEKYEFAGLFFMPHVFQTGAIISAARRMGALTLVLCVLLTVTGCTRAGKTDLFSKRRSEGSAARAVDMGVVHARGEARIRYGADWEDATDDGLFPPSAELVTRQGEMLLKRPDGCLVRVGASSYMKNEAAGGVSDVNLSLGHLTAFCPRDKKGCGFAVNTPLGSVAMRDGVIAVDVVDDSFARVFAVRGSADVLTKNRNESVPARSYIELTRGGVSAPVTMEESVRERFRAELRRIRKMESEAPPAGDSDEAETINMDEAFRLWEETRFGRPPASPPTGLPPSAPGVPAGTRGRTGR